MKAITLIAALALTVSASAQTQPGTGGSAAPGTRDSIYAPAPPLKAPASSGTNNNPNNQPGNPLPANTNPQQQPPIPPQNPNAPTVPNQPTLPNTPGGTPPNKH